MSIYYFKPYSPDKNLGKAYNDYMKLLPADEDWACLMDGDTMFLNNNYGTQIEACIKRYPDIKFFTAVTNRIGNKKQLYQGHFSEVSDIKVHRRLAQKLQEDHWNECQEIKAPVSGFLMLIQKKAWKHMRFTEGKELLGVDTNFSKRYQESGGKIAKMLGVYVLHYYRLNEGKKHKKHL